MMKYKQFRVCSPRAKFVYSVHTDVYTALSESVDRKLNNNQKTVVYGVTQFNELVKLA